MLRMNFAGSIHARFCFFINLHFAADYSDFLSVHVRSSVQLPYSFKSWTTVGRLGEFGNRYGPFYSVLV